MKLKMRIKSVVISASAAALNLVDDHIVTDRPEIGLVDHLRWALERPLHWLFELAYAGSDEEIRSVWDGEIPPYAMSDRQRRELPADLYTVPVQCSHCGWESVLALTHEGRCLECAGVMWLRA